MWVRIIKSMLFFYNIHRHLSFLLLPKQKLIPNINDEYEGNKY